MAVQAVSRIAENSGAAAKNPFFLLDKDGLVTKERKNFDPMAAPFARDPAEIEGLREGASLLEVVKKLKPHVLLGLSGVGGVFSEEVLKAMRESDSIKLAIFAMSNLTVNAECTAEDAFKHGGENIVFGSGSPFENVDLGNGKVGHVNQANNMYLFPGIGLGALLSGVRLISDGMLQAASECLASYMTDEDIHLLIVFEILQLRWELLLCVQLLQKNWLKDIAKWGPESCCTCQKRRLWNMWFPIYSPLVHEK